MESVNPKFAPSHSTIEHARIDQVFFSLREVSTERVALLSGREMITLGGSLQNSVATRT